MENGDFRPPGALLLEFKNAFQCNRHCTQTAAYGKTLSLSFCEAGVNVRSNATAGIVGYILSVTSELKTTINVVFRHDLSSSASALEGNPEAHGLNMLLLLLISSLTVLIFTSTLAANREKYQM